MHTSTGDTTRTYAYPASGAARPHAVTSVTQAGVAGAATSTFAYDAAGNTTTRNVAGAAGQTLKWDAEGRLEAITQGTATVMQALYTADGDRLIRRQGGVTTVYLPGGQELNLTTATNVVTATRYYSFNGQNIAMRTGMSGSTVSSLVADPHQTATISIANTTKAVTQRRTDPYGNARGTATGTWPGDRGFMNKVQDTSGLTQVGARYYDAKIGRFVSVDPVFETSSPQQWGAYSYADNNPVSYWDPTGLFSFGKWVKQKASSAWRSTTRFVNKYQAEIVGGIVGGVVTGGCLAASWGVGSVGCAALGGAAASAATNLWRSQVQKTQAFSWAALARDTAVVAIAGAAGGLIGKAAVAVAPAVRRGAAALATRAAGSAQQASAAVAKAGQAVAAAARTVVRRATAKSVPSANVRFSQSSVNGAAKIESSMSSRGWSGDPIDAVRMPDGGLTSVDNTRLFAAKRSGIDVRAQVHGFEDAISESQAVRFPGAKGALPSTWGEAVMNRIGNQSAGFRNANPYGSPITGWVGN